MDRDEIRGMIEDLGGGGVPRVAGASLDGDGANDGYPEKRGYEAEHGATQDTQQHIEQQSGYKVTRRNTHPP